MISESKILDHAHQVLRSEAEAILAIDNHLDDSFVKAVELILKKVRTELRSSLRNFESQNEYGYKPCIKRRFQNAETLQSRNQTNSS